MTQKFSSETVGIHTRLDDIDDALDALMNKSSQNELLLKKLMMQLDVLMMDDAQQKAIHRLDG